MAGDTLPQSFENNALIEPAPKKPCETLKITPTLELGV